jgi:hypothetical protein
MINKTKVFSTMIGAAGLVLSGASAEAADKASDPLLDVLIKKGIITQAEAEQVKTEAAKGTPAETTKWKINSAIKSIELYGDVRFRYEHREAQSVLDDTLARDRWRYAWRLGLRGDLADNVFYGFRLESGQNNRSPWVTFGDDSNVTSPFTGPSVKVNDGVNIGQVYLGWKPDDFTFQLGKMPNPIYTMPMTWDSDINPEGFSESWKHSWGNFDFFTTAGQFIYQDTNPDNPAPGIAGSVPNKNDAFMLAFQVGGTYKFADHVSFKLAPVYYVYTGHGASSGINGKYVGQGNAIGANYDPATGQPITNQSGINDLNVLEAPAEFNFPVGSINGRVFGDFAYNLSGDDRAKAAGFPQYDDQRKAYMAGVAFGSDLGLVYGQVAKKHGWEARAYYQHIEQYALDPNILDSDFLEGRGNLQGLYSAFAYGLTANTILTLRYGYGDRIKNDLGTGGNNPDLFQMNPITKYQLFQVDITWRF